MTVDAETIESTRLAEEMFTGRWRLSSLQRVDPELYARLMEQVALYDSALFGSKTAETRLQADATLRGWKAAKARMEAVAAPDDAFQYGTDQTSGCVVAIGIRPPSESRLQLRDGHRVIFVTPDEVAKLVAAHELLCEVKRSFPAAEILSVRAA